MLLCCGNRKKTPGTAKLLIKRNFGTITQKCKLWVRKCVKSRAFLLRRRARVLPRRVRLTQFWITQKYPHLIHFSYVDDISSLKGHFILFPLCILPWIANLLGISFFSIRIRNYSWEVPSQTWGSINRVGICNVYLYRWRHGWGFWAKQNRGLGEERKFTIFSSFFLESRMGTRTGYYTASDLLFQNKLSKLTRFIQWT